jgi:hypothetical protein
MSRRSPGSADPDRAPIAPSALATAAHCVWMEVAAGAAWSELSAAGIPAILLKGPAIARWLYEDELRLSCDVDLLVSPAQFGAAKTALSACGYEARLPGSPACEVGPNSEELLGANGICIDLHHRLIGVPDPPQRCWQVLCHHTVPFDLAGGAQVDVLDLAARTMHLALHAAQDGPVDRKAMADLQRGLAKVPIQDWEDAAHVAQELGALDAFAAGLQLVDGGRRLLERLELAGHDSVELVLRTTSAPQESLFFVRLGETASPSRKASLIARKLWPTATFMRSNYPTARGGPLGLLASRLSRMVTLIPRGAPAFLAWWQARTRVRRSQP